MSGICCQRCLKAPCECLPTPSLAFGDTAPQPPREDTLERCTYCDQVNYRSKWDGQLCPNCGCSAGPNEPWVLLDRIAALEAELDNMRLEAEYSKAAEGMMQKTVAALEAQLAEAQKIRNAEVAMRDEQIEMEKARVRQIDGENQGIRQQLAEAQARLAELEKK